MRSKIIQAKNSSIEKALHNCAELNTEVGENNLLVGGAKASHRGGGWWYVHGYAQDGRDVTKVLDLIEG